MKLLKLPIALAAIFSLLIFAACSGSDDPEISSGALTMSITDAKPLLPQGTTNLWITFEEVLAHKSGGGWISLPMVETPYTIDLLQFHDGNTTDFVPPVLLESGKYTQIRISVSSAVIRFDNNSTSEDFSIEIPSDNLKTDKNINFDVEGGGSVDITVDFDLSKSIVVTGNSGTKSYKLKPVLHIIQTAEAAAIDGSIADTSFVDAQNVVVTVVDLDSQEEYTKVEISKPDTEESAEFSIYWLVPEQDYRVEIDFDPESENGPEFTEDILSENLPSGDTYVLNNGDPI